MSISQSFCVLLVAAVAGAACHTRPPTVAPTRTATATPPVAPAVPPRPPAPPRAAPSQPAAPLTEAELFRRKTLAELNAEQPLSDAFFDYDQDTLRDDARRAIQQDAQWLAKWPQTRVRVNGHSDERGTAEYNLALGARRAAAVRDYLVSLGTQASRLEERSLGKEAPFCQVSQEPCWSQNRRGHFEIVGK